MPPPDPDAFATTEADDAGDDDEAAAGQPLTLSIAQAKQGLAAAFGVPPEAIEITIKA